MIEFYAAGTPNGLKIAIALEWLGLDYSYVPVALGGDAPKPETFVRASPLGKIPVIHDTETGVAIAESGAILVYLAEKTGNALLPSDAAGRATTMMWHFMASSTFGPAFGQAHQYLHFQKGKAPFAAERSANEVRRYYTALNTRFAESEWLAGSAPSIADIALWPWIVRHEWQGVDLGQDYPAVRDWYRRMAHVKAVADGFEKVRGTRDIPMP